MRVLGALFAAAAVLIGVEFAQGAAHAGEARLANPCHARAFHGDAVQRIVLDGLDHAACRLHTSREELVLSLGSGSVSKRKEAALRAGMLRSVDDAERRGDIPHLLAPAVRGVVEHTPLEKLIRGGISLGDLFGSG